MGAIADQPDLLALDLRQVGHRRIDLEAGEGQRLSLELRVDLVEVVRVDVRVSEGMNELPGGQARHLGHQVR